MSRYVIRDLDNFSQGADVPIIWAEDEHRYYGGEKEYISYIRPTSTLIIVAIDSYDPDFTHSGSWDEDGDGTDGFNTCVIVDDPAQGIHGRKGIFQSADLEDDDRQYAFNMEKKHEA